MLAIPARVIATSFTILCFAGTIIIGLLNENGWESILTGAVLAGLIAWVVGTLVGMVMLHSVNEQIDRHREANPIPDESEIYETDPAQAGTG